MTTRGIINGSDTFGIRSVRGKRFKYVLNLSPDVKFTNACTKSQTFQSWIAKAEDGNADAADKVRRYQHRPAEELFDMENDPLEWTNVADDPQYASIKTELKQKLASWMAEQGDLGQQTELEALKRQGRNRQKKNKKSSQQSK